MKFTEETLKKIIWLGADGYSLARIAHELNMTPDQLRDERTNDERLNDTLERAEYNYEQYALSKLESEILNGKKLTVEAKDLYIQLSANSRKFTEKSE